MANITNVSLVDRGRVVTGGGGSGLPNETITYAQFIQMSDAEQLAFTGYVTDYPGIDDEPVADDVIYDNTDSGLTANNVQDAIDEIDTKINNKIVTVEKTNIATNGAGQIAISSLSLPTGAKLLNFSFSQGYFGWIRTDGYIQVVGFNSSTMAISSAANKTISTMNVTYSV